LLPNAGAVVDGAADLRLDGLAAEHAADVVANVEDLLTTEVAKIPDHDDRGGSWNGARSPSRGDARTNVGSATLNGSRSRSGKASGKAWFPTDWAVEPGATATPVRVRVRRRMLRVEKVHTMVRGDRHLAGQGAA